MCNVPMFSFSVTFSFAGVTGMKDTNNFRTSSIVFNIAIKKRKSLAWLEIPCGGKAWIPRAQFPTLQGKSPKGGPIGKSVMCELGVGEKQLQVANVPLQFAFL